MFSATRECWIELCERCGNDKGHVSTTTHPQDGYPRKLRITLVNAQRLIRDLCVLEIPALNVSALGLFRAVIQKLCLGVWSGLCDEDVAALLRLSTQQ